MKRIKLRKRSGKAALFFVLALALCGNASAFIDWVMTRLARLDEVLTQFFMDNVIVPLVLLCIAGLRDLILWNPNPDSMKMLVDDFIELLIPIYVAGLILLGIYMIFLSGSAQGRAKTKNMFWKMVLGMVLVTISLEIFKLLLNISQAVSKRILGPVVTTDLPQFSVLSHMNINSAVGLFTFLLIILLLASMVAVFRYIMVLVACALFPFVLFLYFFEHTKDTGSRFLRYSMMLIFTQVVQALMLAMTVTAMNSIPMEEDIMAGFIYSILLCAGGAMIIISPLIMMGLLEWIGGAVAGTGMVVSFMNPALGGAMVAAGSVAAGMGPGGMMAGGTAYFFGKSHLDALDAGRSDGSGEDQKRRTQMQLKQNANQNEG